MQRLARLVDRVRGRVADPPTSDTTGFYRAGAPGDGPRGEVLATEPIAGLAGSRAWRVRYRTFDAAGRPVAASMALAAPSGRPSRPRPVVAWIHGAVGVAPGCGPSRVGLDVPYATEWLTTAGAVVVAPDLTGLGVEGVTHPYLHGTTAGRSVLDALRAAANLTDAGAGNVAALAGHSAGGHAALWANELARGEDGAGLDLRVAVPVAPVSDLAVTVHHYATTSGHAAFPVQLVATWPGTEPVNADDVLTPAARQRLGVLDESCLGGALDAYRGDAARWLVADGFRVRAWARALGEQSAGRAPGRAPVVIVHGADDVSVPPGWSAQLAADLRRVGGAVELRVCAGADHNGVLDQAREEIVDLLVDAVSDDGG